MKELIIIEDNIPLADSRIVAEKLGVEHESFFRLVTEYQKEVEDDFGSIRFRIGLKSGPKKGGKSPRYALLNEGQANTLMSYTQNTEKARACKRLLVKAFLEAKELLSRQQQELPVYFNKQTQDRCRSNEGLLPEGFWCVETEMVSQACTLQSLQKELKHWCLPAGSGGKAWINHLRDIKHPLLDEDSKVALWVPNLPCPIKIMVYPYALLSEFRRWLRVEYAEYYDTKYSPSRVEGDGNKRIS